MGLVKKLGRPITAAGPTGSTRPIGHRAEGNLQGSGRGAEAQIRQRQAPFANDGALRFQAPANAGFRADQVQGSSAGGTRPRNWQAAQPSSQPMSQPQLNRAVGYKPSTRSGSHGAAKFGGPARRLIPQMSDADFALGAKLYRKEHGNF
jgi:hypothetical protein